MTILVTGAAGFIGWSLVKEVCSGAEALKVVGVDSMNDYYDVGLKDWRLRELEQYPGFTFIKGNIADKPFVDGIFEEYRPEIVVNLAAQAGVRPCGISPDTYIESNIIGFYNILEACRCYPVRHLVYASSSSVYGANTDIPYSVEAKTDTPLSLYAATKKSNELLAHAYSDLYGVPSTALRFFSVYGPAGRPDMAYFSFTDKLVRGETIQVFNQGRCSRDFTYINDIVEGMVRVMNRPPQRTYDEDGSSAPPYAVYNIGNSHPENLVDFIKVLHEELIRAGILPEGHELEAQMEFVPMHPGDMAITCADTSALERDFGFKPSTPLREGLRSFVNWYSMYHHL